MLNILFAGIALGAAEPGRCPEGTVFVEERKVETADAIYIQPICRRIQPPRGQTSGAGPYRPYVPGFDSDPDFHRAMIALARRLNWPPAEIARVDQALTALVRPNLPEVTPAQFSSLWSLMRARSADPVLVAAAATGEGPRPFRAGWQSGRYGDCALFALATGSGVPYGVVAGRANELLRSAEWRIQRDREQPERVLKHAGGLNGGEVIMLAEALGRVSIVRPEQFAATLKAGRPVLVSMTTRAGGAHQVVLSRIFRHKGADWYEVINSQHPQPQRSDYVTHGELLLLAEENGITLRPEPGTVVKPLR